MVVTRERIMAVTSGRIEITPTSVIFATKLGRVYVYEVAGAWLARLIAGSTTNTP